MFKSKFLIFSSFFLFSKSLFSQEKGIDDIINEAFQPISSFWESLVFHEFFGTGIPTIIFLLVGGAGFFTFYFGFINIRGFGLSLKTVMGKV